MSINDTRREAKEAGMQQRMSNHHRRWWHENHCPGCQARKAAIESIRAGTAPGGDMAARLAATLNAMFGHQEEADEHLKHELAPDGHKH